MDNWKPPIPEMELGKLQYWCKNLDCFAKGHVDSYQLQYDG